MIDIIIESPFLPQRKIQLNEHEWTIEKLTELISSKFKVLGKSIDKNVVCYTLHLGDGKIYDICKINDYPLNFDLFKKKLVDRELNLVDNIFRINVTFSKSHFNSVSKSVHLLESDTLDKFLQRHTRRNSFRNSIVNIDNSELKSIEVSEYDLNHFSKKYIEYKLNVNDKWKNILAEMKKQKLIGVTQLPVIETENESIDISEISEKIDDLGVKKEKIQRKKTKCSCVRKLFKKKSKKQKVQANFHYNFEDDIHPDKESEASSVNNDEQFSYHDENIVDEKTEGTMFYTWDDDDDFLLD